MEPYPVKKKRHGRRIRGPNYTFAEGAPYFTHQLLLMVQKISSSGPPAVAVARRICLHVCLANWNAALRDLAEQSFVSIMGSTPTCASPLLNGPGKTFFTAAE
ncbi:hypothetical protein [Pseudorhodobacter aquimaris]|uniref:hypothetical protein n=1 Tax=Pseudorhodobacter aquimaris TaxID=687412 RepID=UPI0012EE51A0|nr:hypothetical protein [Pseudorhodobacter aquimaris]